VPHISLVFCEMWDTADLDLHFSTLQGLPIDSRGIPHLAKNERDMGHPLIRGRDGNWTGRFSLRLFSPSFRNELFFRWTEVHLPPAEAGGSHQIRAKRSAVFLYWHLNLTIRDDGE
jgi:hypothetical protein